MAHAIGKDIYQKLGGKIDGLHVRVARNQKLYTILKELYSPKEAEVVVKMPYSLSRLERISKSTGYQETELRSVLEKLCEKGLVIDLCLKGVWHYIPSPMVIGIFEFTMMRTGEDHDPKKYAKLFHEYLLGDGSFFSANMGRGQKIALARALPYEEAVLEEEMVEVLDYEKAKNIVETARGISLGTCSCRHEKMHVGAKACDVPLDSCTSFGAAADYLIRNRLAKEISKNEMLELLARSREMGLVLNADNVQKRVSFICHCCGCCCNMLQGIKKFGFANTIMTSSYIAAVDFDKCKSCGKCSKACPIDAIDMRASGQEAPQQKKRPEINKDFCLGCGVCSLSCPTESLKLVKRKQKILTPETTFERVVLQCLEQGTLQNQLFDDTQKISHKFMRVFLGTFLKLPPIKRALLSDTLRSRFLSSLKKGAEIQKKKDVVEL